MPEAAAGTSNDAAASGGDAAAIAAAATAAAGATNDQTWYPAEHKDYIANKGWKNAGEAVTSAINLEKLMGADKAGRTIVMPKDANDVEGTKAFRERLGVPATAEAYELPVPQGHAADFAKTASAWFHEAGIPKGAAQKITEQWNTHFAGVIQAQEAESTRQQQAQLDTLKTSWGPQFDANTEIAKRSAKQFAAVAQLDQANVQSIIDAVEKSAPVRQLFAAIGKSVGEHGFAAGEGTGGGGFAPQRTAIQKQIKDLMDNRIAGKVTEKPYLQEIERLNMLLESAA